MRSRRLGAHGVADAGSGAHLTKHCARISHPGQAIALRFVSGIARYFILNTRIAAVLGQINRVVVAKEQQVKLAIACLLTGGHVLIDDVPGVGKTTLSHALASSFGLNWKRIQFTSDLLPSDILGISVFDPSKQGFSFHPGAVFTQVLLGDEINRASAKTQSALLEAMEERQVTVDGQSHPLPTPFMLIATQNPQEQHGANALPESQLDRFSVRIVLGYPEADVERRLWKGENGRQRLAEVEQLIDAVALQECHQEIQAVFVSDALLDYLHNIVQYTRRSGRYVHGLSPRAALTLLDVTRAWAFIHGADFATPRDMQTVLPYVAVHRLRVLHSDRATDEIADELGAIPIP
ncbi:MAG: MoxR family ATPase [Pseudomonadota bacterium]